MRMKWAEHEKSCAKNRCTRLVDRLYSSSAQNRFVGVRMELQHLDTRARSSELDRMIGNAKRASSFLKALAHESRLLILCILAEGEKSVSELEDLLSLRQPTVSQQLARLRSDGLVSTRRDGKAIYYKLASDDARVVIGAIYDVFCRKLRKR
jgi:DNA-binding transcriptional ArsR family regulator